MKLGLNKKDIADSLTRRETPKELYVNLSGFGGYERLKPDSCLKSHDF
jgi:hypothetical protein